MPKLLSPLPERTLTLIFQSEEDVKNWVAWYCDGGGAEAADYDPDIQNSQCERKALKELILTGDPERCPECKSTNYLNLADPDPDVVSRLEYWSERIKFNIGKQYFCEDCEHKYNVEE